MTGYIYAIGRDDAVKIGWAGDPRRRLSELNVASPEPLSLIGFLPGNKSDEAAAHEICAGERIRGEWFRRSGAVIEFLSGLTAPGPVLRSKPAKSVPIVINTFKDHIDEIGVAPLAGLLSVEESHVRTMKARDSIPPEYWGAILAERQRLGLAEMGLDELLQMRSERFARPSNIEAAEDRPEQHPSRRARASSQPNEPTM